MGVSFNPWLIARGLITPPMRMRQNCQSALKVIQFLESHPKVEKVFYPGLKSHPYHELAARQMSDFGGMLTFQLKSGLESADDLIRYLDQALRARTFKGMVGPLAYEVMKGIAK